METDSDNSSVSIRTDEFLSVIGEFLRYRRSILSDLPEELLRQKERIDKLESAESKRFPDHDLFYRVGMVLNRAQEPLAMGELSKELSVPLSSATRIVDKLVEGGYAMRVADPEDRRVVRVALTQEGRDNFRVLYKFVRERIEQIMERFTDEERRQLVFLLRKAATVLGDLVG